MAIGVHDGLELIERGRKLVLSLEAGDGRAAFSDAGYGEGDHAQGLRLLNNAELALIEAQKPASRSLRTQQYLRAYRGWLDVRGEELRRDGLHALHPKLVRGHALELVAGLRTVARGGVAEDGLDAAAKELKDWLERWTPLARRVVQQRPELSERFGVTAPATKDKKPSLRVDQSAAQ